MKHNEMILREWFFQEPIENNIRKISNPKTLRQLARDNIGLDDRQLNGELGRKMLNP